MMLEKHVQTLMAALVLGILIWVGNSVQEGVVNTALLTQRIVTLEENIKVFTTTPRFDLEDFTVRMYPRDQIQSKHTAEIKSMNDRLMDLERGVRK